MSNFSFPYPELAAKARKRGEGCLSCVHRTYCPAMYWMKRYVTEGRTIDDHNGIQCASWSNNMADQVKTEPTDDDLNEGDYQFLQGISSEADRCGLSDTTTGTSRRP